MDQKKKNGSIIGTFYPNDVKIKELERIVPLRNQMMAVFFTFIDKTSRVLSFPKGKLKICPVKILYCLLYLPACYLDPSGVTCPEKPWLDPQAHETCITSSDAETLWYISPRSSWAWFQVAIQCICKHPMTKWNPRRSVCKCLLWQVTCIPEHLFI